MDELRNVWQNQEVEPMKISVDELRARAAKFQHRIQRRNLREQVACVAVVLIFGWMAWKNPHPVPRAGFALIIAGALYIAWHLHRWGTASTMPGGVARESCVAFYRAELGRQRDLLQGIWKWYLGPMIPGMALIIVNAIWTAPAHRRWFPSAYAVVASAFFWFVARLNQRAAGKLDAQIAALDRELA